MRIPENPEPWLAWLERRGYARPANFWDIYRPANGVSEQPTNAPPGYGADETETAFLTEIFLEWLASHQAPLHGSGKFWFVSGIQTTGNVTVS